MAYQNVGTPRFFVDHGLWLNSVGQFTPAEDQISFIQLNPSNIQQRGSTHLAVPRLSPINYIAFLGTVESTTNPVGYYPEWWDGTNYYSTASGFTEIVNCDWYSQTPEQYNGFSMATFNDNPSHSYLRGVMASDAKCGAISIGSTYEMPHSPDLKLTMSREMDGAKRIRTKGGADLVKHQYTKPAMWGDAGAWELYSGTPNHALARSGRRVWDLSFSYLQDSDVFPMLSSLNPYESWNADGDNNYSWDGDDWHLENTLLDSNNFYSQVIHKTNGGQLPFIFQPDKDNSNPDQFAICKFDMKEFKFDQVANSVYNCKIKIREVW